MPMVACRSPLQGPAIFTAPPLRCDLPRGVGFRRALAPELTCRRIIRRVGFAKNVDRVAGLKAVSHKSRIGVEREVDNRNPANRVKHPGRDTFHASNFTLGGPSRKAGNALG